MTAQPRASSATWTSWRICRTVSLSLRASPPKRPIAIHRPVRFVAASMLPTTDILSSALSTHPGIGNPWMSES
ncbi:hypothetical protein ACFPRL_18020 [Pseudoclavibacter helvolus]